MSESKKQQKHFYLRNNDALMNSTKLSMKANLNHDMWPVVFYYFPYR